MVEGDNRFDAVFQASVDDVVVVCETLLINRSTPEREDTRPGYAEGIGGDA